MVYDYIMGASWLAFIIYWVVSSIGIKKDRTRASSLLLSVGARVLIGAVVFLVVRLFGARRVAHIALLDPMSSHPAVRAAGAVLCVAGVAVAIWARATLGRNWSGRPATKEDHELVTSGPYHMVRHPIYSGMLLAMLGTTLITGIPGLVVMVAFGVVAVYRIGVEERLMIQLFPDAYVEYRKHTKTLIPFVV